MITMTKKEAEEFRANCLVYLMTNDETALTEARKILRRRSCVEPQFPDQPKIRLRPQA